MIRQQAWTPSEDDVIIQGITRGMIWKDIAQSLPGRTSRTARMRAQRMGVMPRRKVPMEAVYNQAADSALLLAALESQFHKAARQMRVDYLDARSLLMDGRFAV